MKRALIVGINDYPWAPLKGCIEDAKSMKATLTCHYDDTPNFACKVLTSDNGEEITIPYLTKHIEDLFSKESDIALLYFSGHGMESNLDGYLVTQDAKKHAAGVTLSWVITLANQSKNVREVFIILDCCHSGFLGTIPSLNQDSALLRKGISILTSSQHYENSVERNGQSLFTSILVNGLHGGAADILGHVTATSLYNYVDKILSPWEQRPVFKSHITAITTLRYCEPKISFSELRKITDYFSFEDYIYPLDPSYEPTENKRNSLNEEIFRNLQKCTSANLVEPIDEDHMYYAAIRSKGCKLTLLGKLYWKMIKK